MMRVLFVDDEQRVLDALRRSLHRRRDSWEMHFACGAGPALELLSAHTYSVVVSDMRMPEVDGAELLGHVRAQQPAAARIVLSGHSELDAALRTAGVAHRFLDKPCDSATLIEVIDGVEDACAVLTPAERELLHGRAALPTPARCLALVEDAVSGRQATAREAAVAVGREPATAAKLLQLANPAFFGTGAEVQCLDTAVMRLGLTTLRSLLDRGLLAEPAPASAEHRVEAYARHASAVARVAVLLAEPSLRPQVQAAALLQHTGRLLVTGDDDATPGAGPGRGASAGRAAASLLHLWGIPAPVRRLVQATEVPAEGERVEAATGRLAPTHLMRLARLLLADSALAATAGLTEPVAEVEAELAGLLECPRLRPWASDVRRLAQQVHDEEAAA